MQMRNGNLMGSGEAVNVRPRRQRKQIGAFQLQGTGIDELLFHRGDRHLVGDLDRHAVEAHLQRGEGEMPGNGRRRVVNNDQPVGPIRI